MLETLEALRHVLKAKRHRRGSIDFDVPEVKVKLDDKGHPVALIKREGSLAESIIEECMLIANETVARHMDTKHQPFMYRVHEQPSDEKIERLNNLLGAFGLFVHQSEMGDIKPMDVQQVLEKVKGKPEERIISTVALRSMQQARYSDMSLGHFGLAARYYTHFTSPIRRYPDLIVHRLLRETFATGSIPAERQAKLRTMLPEIADHASERERIAIEAERETTDMKKIEYMAQFVGEEFSGIISGVTAFGIFVELDNGVEGLVHVSTMVDDFYEYREEQFAMVGERTNKAYRLGDEVEILLVRANVEERNLDFVLKDNGAYDPLAMKNAVRGGRNKGPKPAKSDKNGKGDKAKDSRQDDKKRPARRPIDDIIADLPTDEGEEKPAKKKRSHGKKNRGASGEKLSRPEHNSRVQREKRERRERRESRGGERFGNRQERRDRENGRGERDYHRVTVTGLNSAVWPDPPGYHERKLREESRAEKAKAAPKHRPRPHRKTEGGTSSNK